MLLTIKGVISGVNVSSHLGGKEIVSFRVITAHETVGYYMDKRQFNKSLESDYVDNYSLLLNRCIKLRLEYIKMESLTVKSLEVF